MSYSKYEFKEAIDDSQIAYLGCLKFGYDALYTGKKDQEAPTLEEIILASMGKKDFSQALSKAEKLAVRQGKQKKDISIVDIVQFSRVLTETDRRILQELSPKCFNYRIKDIYDTNNLNGFYSCCIDKGDGKISLAFRGSEKCKVKSNFDNDWRDADLALLQNEETVQQKEVYYMLKYYRDIGVLNECKSIDLAGHSLGGNLATHCGVLLASEEFESFFPKLHKAFNLDGPGFSKKYLKNHKEEIKKVGIDADGNTTNIVQHPKWSLIGDLLHDLTYYSEDGAKPAENSSFLKIDEEKLSGFTEFVHRSKSFKIEVVDSLKKHFFRHSTEVVTPRYDENNRPDMASWEVEEGKQDTLSKFFGSFSRGVDTFVPTIITRNVGRVCTWIAEKVIIRPKDIELKPVIRGIDDIPDGGDTHLNDGTYHRIPKGFYNTATDKYNYKEPEGSQTSSDNDNNRDSEENYEL